MTRFRPLGAVEVMVSFKLSPRISATAELLLPQSGFTLKRTVTLVEEV